MVEKKPVCLVITDIDNTIADKFGVWGSALDIAIEQISKLYNRDRENLVKDLLDHVPENMKHISGPYIGKDLRSDVAHTPSLQPVGNEQVLGLERIFHQWDKNKSKAELYEGVLPAMNKIKSAGAKIVLYTDSRESVCIPRLAKMGITADMVDAVYAQPDLKEGHTYRKPVAGAALALREGLGDRLVLFEPKTNKPHPQNMQQIMNDMGVKDASAVVMVGDNIRADGTGAIAVGANFAWQKAGTVIDEVTLKCYKEFCQDPHYKLTTADHLEQMDATNKPTEILEGGFKDLVKHYHFVSHEKGREIKLKETIQNKAVSWFFSKKQR